MASVDGRKSLLGACDEVFDIICAPCKTDEVNREAKHYCTDCKEYLCDSCKDSHLKFKISKNHKIQSGLLPTFSSGNSFTIPCSCNQNREIVVYCVNHDDVICDSCKTVKHRKCNLQTIREKCFNYTAKSFDSIWSKAQKLKAKVETLQRRCTSDKEKIKNLSEKCKEDARTFRKDIETFFDNLERDMLTEIDTLKQEVEVKLDHHIQSLTTMMQMLYPEYKLLEDAKNENKKEAMFAAEIKVSKGIAEYDCLLADIKKYFIPQLIFERSQLLIDMKVKTTYLGLIKRSDTVKDMSVKASERVNVKYSEDQIAVISGCAFMPDGSCVSCDYANRSVKLLDETLALEKVQKLTASPADLSVVDDSNIIVTLPEVKALQYMQVFPELETGLTIQLDKSAYGIHSASDEIFVTCHDNPGQGEVRVLDRRGETLRKLGVNHNGEFMFKSPSYIAVSEGCEKIYVSDDQTSIFTCMASNGNVVYGYKNEDFKGPGGIFIDVLGNAIVCDTDSHKVLVITPDGRKFRDLLTFVHGITKPISIAYRVVDWTLVVGCYYKNDLFSFKLG